MTAVIIGCLAITLLVLVRAGIFFARSGASIGARVVIGLGLFGFAVIAIYVGFVTQQIGA
jgi:hypothetical protein